MAVKRDDREVGEFGLPVPTPPDPGEDSLTALDCPTEEYAAARGARATPNQQQGRIPIAASTGTTYLSYRASSESESFINPVVCPRGTRSQ